MPLPVPASTNILGVLCAMAAAVSFTLNDVGIKFLSGDYPLHEVVLIRASCALLITVFLFMPLEGGWTNLRTSNLGLQFLRGCCVVAANMCFFLGLAALPRQPSSSSRRWSSPPSRSSSWARSSAGGAGSPSRPA